MSKAFCGFKLQFISIACSNSANFLFLDNELNDFGNGIIMKLKIIAINTYLCAIHGKKLIEAE